MKINMHSGGPMKSLKVFLVGLALIALAPLAAEANNWQPYKQKLENIDAVQAIALANEWKWTQNDITAHVDSMEVVFEFPDNTVKRIPLPADKMVVAIAPYLTYTHG